jgi:hypothetical protein
VTTGTQLLLATGVLLIGLAVLVAFLRCEKSAVPQMIDSMFKRRSWYVAWPFSRRHDTLAEVPPQCPHTYYPIGQQYSAESLAPSALPPAATSQLPGQATDPLTPKN